MGWGDSTASKVMKDEEDLRSDGCRSGRSEEVGNLLFFLVVCGCRGGV